MHAPQTRTGRATQEWLISSKFVRKVRDFCVAHFLGYAEFDRRSAFARFVRPVVIDMNRALKCSLSFGLAFGASLALATASHAQARRGAQQQTPPAAARDAAPIDITGHWVSLITDDWVYRMITPAKGDVSYVPLNAEGRRIAEAWDPARDEAAGEQCKGYAAPAIMRLPSRVEIAWQDDNTLKLDIDTGMQTRLFHFGQNEPQGARSWQGWSSATWQLSGTTEQFYPGPTSLGQIKRTGEGGRGMALAGTITGYVGLAFIVIGILLFFAFLPLLISSVNTSV